jgi:hypothetical protein
MRYAIASVTALALAVAFVACSSRLGGGGGGAKKGTIVLYRNASNVCRTSTTPFMKLKPSKVKWKIDDEFDCITGSLVVKLEFPTGDLYACNGLTGTREIECDLERLDHNVGATKYNVVFGTEREDPELQIEM